MSGALSGRRKLNPSHSSGIPKRMTIARQVLVTELDYNVWANEILLEACSTRSSEELSRHLGASHISIIRTLRHIYDGERFWVRNLITRSIPDVAEMEAAGAADQCRPDPELESLRQSWPGVWSDARQWIAPLSDEDLALELASTERDGTIIVVPRWQVILHMVNHSTLHRGQIVNLFRALGKATPRNTDLFTFYRIRNRRQN